MRDKESNNPNESSDEIKWIDEPITYTTRGDTPPDNSHSHTVSGELNEALAQKTLELKKKELRWKLMQASQKKNREKLEEIRTETNYHKNKLAKAEDLAAKLRSKYVKVVKSARLTQEQLKESESQLSSHEKFVADEKMQITKLAIDCVNIGKEIYGPSYKLQAYSKKEVPNTSDGLSSATVLAQLSPFLREARVRAISEQSPTVGGNTILTPTRKQKKAPNYRLSSIYDIRDSLLKNLASFRLTNRITLTDIPLTHSNYSHKILPHEYVCLPDLLNECTDRNCLYQHKSNYLMTDLEILTDILSYNLSYCGFKPDPELTDEENSKLCRVKLKQRAAALISRNSDKTIEIIVRNIAKKLRGQSSDPDIITKTRELPKYSLKAPPVRCPCRTNSDVEPEKCDLSLVKMEVIEENGVSN